MPWQDVEDAFGIATVGSGRRCASGEGEFVASDAHPESGEAAAEVDRSDPDVKSDSRFSRSVNLTRSP
jgi:hypothetical protein